MAQTTKTMEVDRVEELNKLLRKLRKGEKVTYSDVDLVFKYLERFLSYPGGVSKKLETFEIKHDSNRAAKVFKVTWLKYDYEQD